MKIEIPNGDEAEQAQGRRRPGRRATDEDFRKIAQVDEDEMLNAIQRKAEVLKRLKDM